MSDAGRLDAATLGFGLLSAVAGVSLTGADRDLCAVLALVGGVVVVLTRPRAA